MEQSSGGSLQFPHHQLPLYSPPIFFLSLSHPPFLRQPSPLNSSPSPPRPSLVMHNSFRMSPPPPPPPFSCHFNTCAPTRPPAFALSSENVPEACMRECRLPSSQITLTFRARGGHSHPSHRCARLSSPGEDGTRASVLGRGSGAEISLHQSQAISPN